MTKWNKLQWFVLDNDHKNEFSEVWKRLTVLFLSISMIKLGFQCPLKSMVISILLKIGTVKLLKNLHPVLIVKK